MEMTGEKTTGDLLDWMELSVHLQHKRVIELQPPSGLEMKSKANLLPTKPEYSEGMLEMTISFPVPSVIL